MKRYYLILMIFLCSITLCLAQGEALLLDDFEGPISGGPEGTVDFGAGNGSSVEVSAATDVKYSGNQSIKVTFDAVSGGYMWVARGFGLDAKNTAWLVSPEDIKWDEYKAISFYMYGCDSKAQIALDIKDSGNEMWRILVEDNLMGFKQIVCPFQDFFARSDWQPGNADKNGIIDFPIKSLQFEPLPETKGTLYFDTVELTQ